jgi:hypothetical protein
MRGWMENSIAAKVKTPAFKKSENAHLILPKIAIFGNKPYTFPNQTTERP